MFGTVIEAEQVAELTWIPFAYMRIVVPSFTIAMCVHLSATKELGVLAETGVPELLPFSDHEAWRAPLLVIHIEGFLKVL